MAFQRLRVTIKGQDPIDVQTNARDWAALVLDGDTPRFDMMFRLAHNALMRTGNDAVPRDYDGFLDALDANVETLEDDSPDVLDPTQPGR